MIKQEIKESIIYRYLNEDVSCAELAKDFGFCQSAISKLLNRNNIKVKLRRDANRKYSINASFFKKIDTEDKAYFLGLLYADGCNFPENRIVSLTMQEIDVEVVQKLNESIYQNRPLYFKKKATKNHSDCFTLTICSKEISEDLTRLGCVKAKSLILEFPDGNQLPVNFIRHFIRGYIDGDGCVFFNKKRPGQSCVTITSSTVFCLKLKEILEKLLSITSTIACRHKEQINCSTLSIIGYSNVISLLEWIYKDSALFLSRKFNKFKLIKNYGDNRKLKPENKKGVEKISSKELYNIMSKNIEGVKLQNKFTSEKMVDELLAKLV